MKRAGWKFLILDGFVDEPTCLGVPPSIAPYVRYTAGAALCAGAQDVDYRTIDQIRANRLVLDADPSEYAGAAVIAGNPVPGKYLGGLPIQDREIPLLASANPSWSFYLGGPIQFDSRKITAPNLRTVNGDIEQFVFNLLDGDPREETRTVESLDRFATAGASIVRKHPRYPELIAEIETGRGCPRRTHCSFCIDGSYPLQTRSTDGVFSEIRALRDCGVRHFRIGKQADLFAYGSDLKDWKNGFPRPNPGRIEELYSGIRSAAPDLKVLHLDNVNPGTLANFPGESRRICETIVRYNTPGDVAALGMESADPAVIAGNSLKASPEEVRTAIRIINETGAQRENGIPKLLPGVNLIHGLAGENRDTFRLNYEFLKSVLDEGLLLRRINVRQVKISGHTDLAKCTAPSGRDRMKLDAAFRKYREMIRDDVDAPMIRRIFPPGTVLPDLIVESRRGDWSVARALGSYAVAVNIPRVLPLLSRLDAFAVGYRERSLVGLPRPFSVSGATLAELKTIPGLSRRAGEVLARRDATALEASPIYDKIRDHLKS